MGTEAPVREREKCRTKQPRVTVVAQKGTCPEIADLRIRCHYCKIEGQLALACRTKRPRDQTYPQPSNPAKPRRKVHHLEEENPSSCEEDLDPINTIISTIEDPTDKSPPIHVQVTVAPDP